MKNQPEYKNFFKGKKITVMGLGLLGRSLGCATFLAQCGADIIVTDLKTEKELISSVRPLKKFKNVKFVLGRHRMSDFRNRDMILKVAGVPLDSPYIKEAKKNHIPVEMDVSLFAKLAPGTVLVGITGTRGKSMTASLIYEILKKNQKFLGRKVYVGGNFRGVATLPLLKKIKKRDIVVCELDSWQLQGFGEAKISPHVSVFTSFLNDHMNYYKGNKKRYFADKANIFKYQKRGDVLIVRPEVKKLIPKNIKSRLITAKGGTFQEENRACAVEAAARFGITKKKAEEALKNFKGLEGRLQYVKTVRGVKIYNDNNATTPEATMAGLEILAGEAKNIILIAGGADKKLPLNNFVEIINKYCKVAVLLPGTGTARLKIKNAKKVKTLSEALGIAMKIAEDGDLVLFSPGFASFGMFKNEYDRGDRFMKEVGKLK